MFQYNIMVGTHFNKIKDWDLYFCLIYFEGPMCSNGTYLGG